mmetsp:Transcript_80933/g.121656  ORF Transcript_80933/g.121656 Transcript_80933/m.121656 type:complete len:232 (-) Transcript_80933:215-910(-)
MTRIDISIDDAVFYALDAFHQPCERCQQGRPGVRRPSRNQGCLRHGKRVSQGLEVHRDFVFHLHGSILEVRINETKHESYYVSKVLARWPCKAPVRYRVLVTFRHQEVEQLLDIFLLKGSICNGTWVRLRWSGCWYSRLTSISTHTTTPATSTAWRNLFGTCGWGCWGGSVLAADARNHRSASARWSYFNRAMNPPIAWTNGFPPNVTMVVYTNRSQRLSPTAVSLHVCSL